MLELRNVPTKLLLYAVQQWLPCHKYAKKTTCGNNTNPFLKGISVWLILKSQSTSGNIQNYRLQLPALASQCKMCVRTLEKYIKWLAEEKLLHVKDKALYLHDYKTVRRYGIDIAEKEQTIYYDTTNTTTLAEIIISIAIMRFKERWMKMYWQKITTNQDEYNTLYDLLKTFGATDDQLSNPETFRELHLKQQLQAYEEEKSGQENFELLHKHIKANPDLNARADTYAAKLGYNAAMSFCHLKFKLIKKGLINVVKENIVSTCRARKDEKKFHHRWLKSVQQTIWFRCDQVTVNANKFFNNNTPAPAMKQAA